VTVKLLRYDEPEEDGSCIGLMLSHHTRRGTRQTTYVWLTEEQAMHLSNRLQSFAKSQGPLNEIIFEDK
jgi:hypothetical protein